MTWHVIPFLTKNGYMEKRHGTQLPSLLILNCKYVQPFLPGSLALIKRTGVIDADKPISTQVRVLTLSEDSPYETLHSFISNAVAPFFKSYIRESGKADRYISECVTCF